MIRDCKRFILLVLVILFCAFLVNGQAQEISQQELQRFLEHYQLAFQEQDEQKLNQSIQENHVLARTIAVFWQRQGRSLYQSGNLPEGILALNMASDIFQRLGDLIYKSSSEKF